MRRFDLLDEYACCIPRYSHQRANGGIAYREVDLESHASVSDHGLDRPRRHDVFTVWHRWVSRKTLRAGGPRGLRAGSA
jgi:hypothetical protein